MSDHIISKIYPTDKVSLKKIDLLLEKEEIKRDANLDYICAIFDSQLNVVATGSLFGNTLRCLAISQAYQGEQLLNDIVSHLIKVGLERGDHHLFLYTKPTTARFFASLGFYEIVRVAKHIVFLENKKNGFQHYLHQLEKTTSPVNAAKSAAIVINANPFTLGHLYLIEKAAKENELLHVFIVSEDSSLIPFSIRKKLAIDATAHLKNISYHDTGDYMISQATFPSYFQKDQEAVIKSQAYLDLEIFKVIAKSLNINKRYVGDEPTSFVTNIYNQIMSRELPKSGIDCQIVPRKRTSTNQIISASLVRQALKKKQFECLEDFLPATSLDYFKSSQAQPVIETIQKQTNVIHY